MTPRIERVAGGVPRRQTGPVAERLAAWVSAVAGVLLVLGLAVWAFTDIDWLPAVLVVGAIVTGVMLAVLDPGN
jgi:hypothetical protein